MKPIHSVNFFPLDRMEKEISDYTKIEIHVNQFMGSSSSIGANRVRKICTAFRASTEQNSRVGYSDCSPPFIFLKLKAQHKHASGDFDNQVFKSPGVAGE